MRKRTVARLDASSWLVGPAAATAVLVILGFASLALFASVGGLLIAGTVAFLVGTNAASIANSRLGRNAGIVAAYIAVLFVAYWLIALSLVGSPTVGATGGAQAVMPPN